MSGTSMDSITAVLVGFQADQPTIVDSLEIPYSESTLYLLSALVVPGWSGRLEEIAELDHRVGIEFAEAAKVLLRRNPDIHCRAIGSHGQTIFHSPDSNYPTSWQIGDPNIIAENTSIPVIGDWRRRDIAAEGQGAPLVPAFHAALFEQEAPIALLNLGGIANLTLLPGKGINPQGFDTGPANTLLDQWCHQHQGTAYDKEGEWARTGSVDSQLLARCKSDPFFRQSPPKSTGREYFNLDWLLTQMHGLDPRPSATDVQRTLLELTAQSVVDALERHASKINKLYIFGGGINNRFLIERLRQLSPETHLQSTEALGIPPLLMEATAFAWLAQQTLKGSTGNIPSVTGARGRRVLGAIYQ